MKHSEGFLHIVETARAGVREIDVPSARRRQAQGAHLVDVREDHEWEKGHAAGARHIGKGIIERDIEKTIPDKAAEIILYCGGGYRSVLAADALQRMGYTNVSSMAGGWRAWVEEDAPTES